MTDTQFNAIIDRLNRLERIFIQTTPPSRRAHTVLPKAIAVTEPEERKAAMLAMFNSLVCQPRKDKLAQHFAQNLCQPPGKDTKAWRIAPRSVLLNRCALRKAFRPTLAGDDTQPIRNAEKTLLALVEDGVLCVAPISSIDLHAFGRNTMQVYDPNDLPAKFAHLSNTPEDPEATEEKTLTLHERLAQIAAEGGDDDDDDPSIVEIEADEEPVAPKKNNWTVTE